MIRIPGANPATQTFLEIVTDCCDDATFLPGRRAKGVLTELATMVRERNVNGITDRIDRADVQLTDAQWDQISQEIRKAGGGGPAEQW